MQSLALVVLLSALPTVAADSHNRVAAAADCSALKTTKVMFHGIDVSEILGDICEVWPGTFPVTTVEQASDLYNETFKEGGTYDKGKKLIVPAGDATFCWRPNVDRPATVPTGYSCPARLNELWVPERPFVVTPFVGNDSVHYCQKNCSDICGTYTNRGEVSEGLCGCRSAEPEIVGTAGPIWVFEEKPRVVPAHPDGCDFVTSANECYGTCPNSSSPTAVIGDFSPVCSGGCGGNFSHECGFGCASTVGSCAVSVVDQVGEVCRVVGMTVGFLTGQPEVALAVDAVVNLVEFAVGALSELIGLVVNAWTDFQQQVQAVGLVAAIMAISKEGKADADIGKKRWGEAVALLAEVTTALKGWHGWHFESSIAKITSIFLSYGAMVVIDVFKLVAAFMKPRCAANAGVPTLSETFIGDHWRAYRPKADSVLV